jgi:hypothetical protein
MAEEMKRRGLSMMAPKAPDVKKPMEPKVGGEGGESDGGGEMKTHTITEHPDGHFQSQMHGGEPMEHPDHMHLMAHIGHTVTGGDAHHVTHHDGMEAHSHMVHEGGEHEDGGNDPHASLDKMMGGEQGEPHEAEMSEPQESYGGM